MWYKKCKKVIMFLIWCFFGEMKKKREGELGMVCQTSPNYSLITTFQGYNPFNNKKNISWSRLSVIYTFNKI
jgi:hypothetical protein